MNVDDELGRFRWYGDDGVDFTVESTRIASFVEGTPGENRVAGRLVFYTGTDASPTVVTERMRIDSAGRVLIGDILNEDNDAGLTINQGTNTDHCISLKNSDVAHGMTGALETDTYGFIASAMGSDGGLALRGYSAGDRGIAMTAVPTTPDTTDTTGSDAAFHFHASKRDGTGAQNLGADDNLLDIGTGGVARFLIKGDGDLHITTRSAGAGDVVAAALDSFDDVGLVRLFQREVHNDMGVAISKWDDHIQANKEDLIKVGVLSSQGDFRIIQRYEDLLGGAIWQTHERVMALSEQVATLTLENAELHTMLAEGRN